MNKVHYLLVRTGLYFPKAGNFNEAEHFISLYKQKGYLFILYYNFFCLVSPNASLITEARFVRCVGGE